MGVINGPTCADGDTGREYTVEEYQAMVNGRRRAAGLTPLEIRTLDESSGLPTADEVHGLHRFSTGAVRSRDADADAYHLISPVALREMALFFGANDIDYDPSDSLGHYCEALDRAGRFLGTGDADQLYRATANLMVAAQIESGEDWKPFSLQSTGHPARYDRIPPAAWRLVSRRYRLGANKFSAFNYERGMPVSELMNHGIKHLKDHLAGCEDGDGAGGNTGAALWNFLVAIHSLVLWPRLNEGTLRRGDCVPPNVSDDEAADWGSYFA